MHNIGEYIKKHPVIIIALVAGIVLLYLLMKKLGQGTAGAVSPTIVPYAPQSSTAPPGAPSNISTTTSTMTSSVYAPVSSQSTSSVYSPTSSYSNAFTQSTVGPVNTSSVVGPVTTTTTSNTNTYNNPLYGISQLPSGFSGVAGVSTQPLISPVTPIPIPASQVRPPTIASYPPVNNSIAVPQAGAFNPSSLSTYASGGALPSQFASAPGYGQSLLNMGATSSGFTAQPTSGPMLGAQIGGY